MTDAQLVSSDDYGDYSESSFRSVPRFSATVHSPKLRGWRIDPSSAPKLKVMLRRRTRQAEGISWEFPDYTDKEARRQLKQARDDAEALRKEFVQHAQTFKADTQFVSSIHEIVLHPSYLRIIGMGQAALPFIFEELAKRPGHWFPALYAISGVDPVPEEDRGRTNRMVEHWMKWGRHAGHLK